MNTQSQPGQTPEPAAGEREAEPMEGASPALTSDSLLQGQKAVTISHNGSVYRLQTTRQGKLILTK
jgi:hemin uptake protein HemP